MITGNINQTMIWRIFKIVRIPNLFIIAVIEFILHQKFLVSLFTNSGINPEMNDNQFYLLVLYSILLTLSGYIINDIYDVNTDKVNKPKQNWVLLIGRKPAITLYTLLSVFSILISFYLAVQLDKYQYIWITPIVSFLLWAYSRYFKSGPLIGNIWVSIFCSLVIVLIWLSEERSLHVLSLNSNMNYYKLAQWVFVIYTCFAFIITLCRELAKDAEDMEGDKSVSAKTFPIVFGIKSTKYLLIGLHIFLSLVLLIVLICLMSTFTSFQIIYCIALIFMPLTISIYLITKAINPKQFGIVSTLIKCIMISGTLFLLSFSL